MRTVMMIFAAIVILSLILVSLSLSLRGTYAPAFVAAGDDDPAKACAKGSIHCCGDAGCTYVQCKWVDNACGARCPEGMKNTGETHCPNIVKQPA